MPEQSRDIVILASHVRSEERALIDALASRGAEPHVVNDRQLILRPGERPFDARLVVNRCISQTRRLHIGRLLESAGLRVVNSPEVVATCDDRIAMHLALQANGLPLPRTTLAFTPESGMRAVEDIGLPTVVKPVGGSWGRLVAKAETVSAAEAIFEHRAALPNPQAGIVYAQAYVDKPERDIRAIVLGGRVAGAVYRHSDHWVTNVARGARATTCALSPDIEALARTAARAVGGGAVSVDLLETRHGDLFVNEVNSLLEFRAFADATGLDIAGQLADYLLALLPDPSLLPQGTP